MAKRTITPERSELRRKLLEMLQNAGINDVAGMQDLFKEMVSNWKRNWATASMTIATSRLIIIVNGYSEKTMKT